MSDVIRILADIERGDRQAAAELLPLVYDELRRLAASRLAREAPGQTLQPTALVHEAYLRLVGGDPDKAFDGRGHFFAAAAEAMRRILIDRARARHRLKRGGGRRRVPFDLDALLAEPPGDDLLALDEALTALAGEDPAAADAGPAPDLRRADPPRGRRGDGRQQVDRRSRLELRPRLALRGPRRTGNFRNLKKVVPVGDRGSGRSIEKVDRRQSGYPARRGSDRTGPDRVGRSQARKPDLRGAIS